MQYEGWLDTLLHARFPRHDLVIRNLGFSGDEVATRLRSKNFGTPDEWLSGVGEAIGGYQENRLESTNTKADVIFAFFGYNESYAGEAGLPAFRQQLDEWITHTLAQKYNGKSAPRIVLFSPIAHEDLHNPDLPDGRENNVRLELYTRAMSQVAAARGVRFVDLFAPTQALYAHGEDAADHRRRAPQRGRQPPRRRDHRPRAVRRAAARLRAQLTCQRCSAPSPTRASSGSSAIGRPTPSPPSAIAPS